MNSRPDADAAVDDRRSRPPAARCPAHPAGGSGSAAARDVVLERPLGSPFYTAEGPPAAAAAGGDAGPLAQVRSAVSGRGAQSDPLQPIEPSSVHLRAAWWPIASTPALGLPRPAWHLTLAPPPRPASPSPRPPGPVCAGQRCRLLASGRGPARLCLRRQLLPVLAGLCARRRQAAAAARAAGQPRGGRAAARRGGCRSGWRGGSWSSPGVRGQRCPLPPAARIRV